MKQNLLALVLAQDFKIIIMNNEIKDIYKKASVATICTALFKKGLKN